MSLRIPKKDIPKLVLDALRPTSQEVRLVLVAPSSQAIRTVLAQNNAQAKVQVALTGALKFGGALRTRGGSNVVSGIVEVNEIELEDINQLTLNRNGSYSFIGVHRTVETWDYNYNAGTGRIVTRVTYRIEVPLEGAGRYEVLDQQTRGG